LDGNRCHVNSFEKKNRTFSISNFFRHFHDETGELTKCVHLNAGDDAEHVVWCPVDRTLDLYANHKDFLKVAVNRLDAFW